MVPDLTTADMAHLWQRSENTIRRLCASGQLKGCYKVGSSWYLPAVRVMELRGLLGNGEAAGEESALLQWVDALKSLPASREVLDLLKRVVAELAKQLETEASGD